MNLTDKADQAAGIAADRLMNGGADSGIVVHTDPEQYQALAETAGKIRTTPEMRARSEFADASSAVFISVLRNGELAATIGVRCWTVTQPFVEFLDKLYGPLYADGEGAIDTSHAPPVFDAILGRACYVGEFFIAPAWRRKIGIGDLSILAYAEACRRWAPDWFWGYVREQHAKAGLSIQYHGTTSYQRAVIWRCENPYHRSADRFVCSHRTDIDWAFDRFTEDAVSAGRPAPRTTEEAVLPLSSAQAAQSSESSYRSHRLS